MPEPSPRPRPRANPRKLVARLAALAAAGAVALSLAVPAAALGEDGPFPFPAETETLQLVPRSVTRIPLESLVQDELEAQVDLDSTRLTVPQDLDPALRQGMELERDALSITVEEEGTWSLIGRDLVFTPLAGADPALTPIALTVAAHAGPRSLPIVLTPEQLELEQVSQHGSAGEVTAIPLGADPPQGGRVRLDLALLPAGSTVVADGSRATVPDQGLWQLSADGTTLTHTPSTPGLGRQLDPVRVVVEDDEGAVVRAAQVTLTVPIISDLDWSAPFGEEILFVVAEGQQYVDPATLRLQPLGDAGSSTLSEDGTRVVVPGEGTWALDRTDATVRFTPESAEVRVTAPMGITGGDGEGARAATALLSTAYPILLDRAQAAPPGTEVQFDLGTGIRDVSSDTLRFAVEDLPEGAELAAGGTELTVPQEGTWRIDVESQRVVMTPLEGFTGRAAPVGITARGVYADNPVSATFEAIVSPVIPTLRDDEGRTAPAAEVSVDVLGNDTAGSGSQPLVPETLELSSLSAVNVAELPGGRGPRLVMPGEGVFSVGASGAVSFTPEEGFRGRTTPITYHVRDSADIPVRASLVVDVDPDLLAGSEPATEVSGINSLLVGLMPAAPGTSIVFATIVLLLLFGGGVSLWIGLRMEADRRAWED